MPAGLLDWARSDPTDRAERPVVLPGYDIGSTGANVAGFAGG